MSLTNIRLRRLRKFNWSRNLIRENNLTINDFIWAVFLTEGSGIKEPLTALPGIYIYSIDMLLIELKPLITNGLNAIMLFPKVNIENKSLNAEESYNPENLMARAIKAIKNEFADKIGVIADVALDPYTIHGHDGIVDNNNYVLNDATVKVLCKQALNQAKAGCDIIAPSDMMDGRVAAIRHTLDEYGFIDVQIMSYAVKFASCFYAPFRQSLGSTQAQPLDKTSYQMDFSNSDETLREIAEDIQEGADSIIIKPAMFYLDVIRRAKDNFNIPIIAYNVSGEYALIMNACLAGIFEQRRIFHELYIGFKRAGADMIIVYDIDYVIKELLYRVSSNG